MIPIGCKHMTLLLMLWIKQRFLEVTYEKMLVFERNLRDNFIAIHILASITFLNTKCY